MSTSLREMAECIGLSGSFSVLGDFYGFWEGALPVVTGGSKTLSLKRQFELLQGPHIHLDIIHVGEIDSNDEATIDAAVHVCRTVFETVGLGVGRVRHSVISEADADGMDFIDSSTEKHDLLGAWNAPGSGIEVFMVRDITYRSVVGSAGYVPDNCGDEPDSDEDGVIVDINRSDEGVARTFAHELGHFLGLSHTCGDYCTEPCDKNNLMTPSGCVTTSALELNFVQRDKMRCHFMVKQGC